MFTKWKYLFLTLICALAILPSHAARQYNGSSDRIVIPASLNSQIGCIQDPILTTYKGRANYAITFWFKTSVGGTIYSEGDPTSGAKFIVKVDTSTGKVTLQRITDSAGNTFTLSSSSDYRNNAWHFVTVYGGGSINGSNAVVDRVHGIIIDNSENLTGFNATFSQSFKLTTQAIGAEWNGSTASNYFNGTIDGLALYSIPLNNGQHRRLYLKQANPYTVVSRPTDLRSWWTLARGDTYDRAQVGSVLTITGTTEVAGVTNSNNIPGCVETLSRIKGIPLFLDAIPTGATNLISAANYVYREPSNIVYDNADIPSRRYKCWIARSPNPPGYSGSNVSQELWTSASISGPWTAYGVVIPDTIMPIEDSFVLLVPGTVPGTRTLYMWGEEKTGATNLNGICYSVSTDGGYTWSTPVSGSTTTLVNNVVTPTNGSVNLPHSPATLWSGDVSSPAIFVNRLAPATKRYQMLVEVRSNADNNGAIGQFTAPAPVGPWTWQGIVLWHGTDGILSNGVVSGREWNGYSQVCDAVFEVNDPIYGQCFAVQFHGNNNGIIRAGVAISYDGETWRVPDFNLRSASRAINMMYCTETTEAMVFDENTQFFYVPFWSTPVDLRNGGQRNF